MTAGTVAPVVGGRTLVAAFCLSAGLVAADRVSPSPAIAVVVGVCGVLLLTGAWFLHGRRPDAAAEGLVPSLGWRAVALVTLGLAAAGFSDLGLRAAATMRAGHGLPGPRPVWLDGVVADDPVPAGRTTRFTLQARSVGGAAGRLKVAMAAYGPPPALRLGDRVSVRTTLAPLDLRDPFDSRLRRRWVAARGTAVSPGIRRRGPSPNPLVRTAGAFRERIEQGAGRALAGPDAGLVLGLTIGDDRGIPDRVQEDFRAAGLSHLTAVSGANVAAVVAATVAVLAAARVPKRVQVGVAGLVLGLFAVVTRWEPSVLRATVMAALTLGAFVFGRRADPLHGLGLAMIALLAFDPFLLWGVGFQLSCAATAGILLLGPQVARRLDRWPRTLAQGAAVTIAAQAAVLPLLVVHFRRLSLAGIPANLAVLPLVPPAMLLGLAGGLVALVSPAAAGPLLHLAGIPASAIRHLARWFASAPHATVPVTPATLGGLVAAAAVLGLAGVGLAWLRRRRARASCPAPGDRPARADHPVPGGRLGSASTSQPPAGLRLRPALVLLVVALAAGVAGRLLFRRAPAPGGIRTTFFDVGQGEAALVQSPGGANVLIDGGPDPEAVAGHLARRGVRRLDLVVFSHDHADHVAGLPAVLRRIPARAVIAPVPGGRFVRGMAPRLVPRQSGEGDRILAGDLVVDVLGPPSTLRAAAAGPLPSPEGGEGSPVNNASLVLRVSWGRGCELFTGDIEEEAQRTLLERHRSEIDCTVLKAPHHGSPRLLAEFVQAVDPEWVTASVGRNSFGHPSLTALAMFDYVGASVLRTDRLGDIVLEMDRAGRVRALR
jgi:competence protein ComEC